jgi:hypothetical protein
LNTTTTLWLKLVSSIANRANPLSKRDKEIFVEDMGSSHPSFQLARLSKIANLRK